MHKPITTCPILIVIRYATFANTLPFGQITLEIRLFRILEDDIMQVPDICIILLIYSCLKFDE